jgi:hypothetical protein
MRLLAATVLSAVCCFTSPYALGSEYAPLEEGSITITFQPTGTAGSAGTWQPCVITPGGEYLEGTAVSYDETTPQQLTVYCGAMGYVEMGNYTIILRNNITDSTNATIVSSMQVAADCVDFTWDTISYNQLPTSSDGQTTMVSYVLPTMQAPY